MRSKRAKIISAALAAIFILAAALNQGPATGRNQPPKPPDAVSPFASFRDIPGVTVEETRAIEALRGRHSHFVYGVDHTTEAFPVYGGRENEVGGYAALVCQWLTDLFGIPFVPALYMDDWHTLLAEFESGEVHFMGDLMATEERRKTYFMTSAISERSLRAFKKDDRSLADIAKSRPPRLAFPRDFPMHTLAAETAEYAFESVFVESYAQAYSVLAAGQADAFVTTHAAEPTLARHGYMLYEHFLPLVFASISLSTRNPDLEPIISVVQKALENGGTRHLVQLHTQGRRDYIKNELFRSLTGEELDYIRSNPVVRVAAEAANYPISFHNNNENEFQGIAVDVLHELALLTGLSFEVVNSTYTSSVGGADMLENGDVSMITELAGGPKGREGRFLWSEIPLMRDYSILISKSEFPDIHFKDLAGVTVGLVRGTGHAALFKGWFPNHTSFNEYGSADGAFNALERGEVDLLLSRANYLLSLENFKEIAGYKANAVLDNYFQCFFGFNKDEAVLRAIVDKALGFIDLEAMSGHWTRKTFDYRAKMAEARQPWLLGAVALALITLALILLLFYRSRIVRKLKEAEAKAWEADERAKLMLEYTPLVVMLWDENLQLIDCNQEAVRIFGLPSKKDYIERFFEFAPEYQPNGMTTREWFLKAHWHIFNRTEFARIEWTHNHAVTGEAIPFDITLVRIKYKDGYAAISYGHDLRERNAAMAKIREADERAQILFDTAPLACFMFDKTENVLDCNQEMVNLVGLPDKEFYFRKFREISPEYQPCGTLSAEVATRHNTITLEKGYHRFEWVLKKFNGELLPTEITLVRVMYRGEYAIAGYIRDLTEQKAAERLAKLVMEKTSTLMAIFDSTPDMMFCKDVNLLYTEFNKAMENHLNIRKSDIIGKLDQGNMNIPPDAVARFFALDKRVIAERQTSISEEQIISHDGRQTHFEIIRSPLIQEGEVTGLVGMARDITQRKAMEEEIKRVSEAKSRFISNMNHEIRSPLNVIVGLTDLMLEENDISAKAREAFLKINTASNTLMELINNALDMSKVEAGKLELLPVPYDVASILNDIITLNMVRVGDKPIVFKLDIPAELPRTLLGDDLRVKQILNNLLSNAFKYTKEGAVTLGAESRREGDSVWVSFSIRDTGIGIRREDLPKLFTEYNQMDTRANREIEGTGLGLNITKKFVEMMDGEIAVESEYGQGTTFRVHIRQGFVNAQPIGAETAESLCNFHYADKKRGAYGKLARADLSHVRVLVVDDSPANLDVAAGMLRKYKMRVDCVTRGRVAVDLIAAGSPVYDAIFMDHMMPVMDGLEATALIRALGTSYAERIPIIALTANAVAGIERMFLDNGFSAYLPKPFNAPNLDSIVQRWVRDKSEE
jgi:PAS domain S-box-containing protein